MQKYFLFKRAILTPVCDSKSTAPTITLHVLSAELKRSAKPYGHYWVILGWSKAALQPCARNKVKETCCPCNLLTKTRRKKIKYQCTSTFLWMHSHITTILVPLFPSFPLIFGDLTMEGGEVSHSCIDLAGYPTSGPFLLVPMESSSAQQKHD